jgi:hypothetical protein
MYSIPSTHNIFSIPKEEIEKIGEENQIYGFPLLSGLQVLVNEILIISKFYKFNYIYGIDLGCGDGKTIDYFNKNIINSEWIGIEMSSYRISLSLNPTNIIEGNLLELDYQNYNFIYVNNLAFDDSLSDKLENKIFTEFTGIIFTTKPFSNLKLIKKIKKIKNVKADTNWQKKHNFNFYLLK